MEWGATGVVVSQGLWEDKVAVRRHSPAEHRGGEGGSAPPSQCKEGVLRALLLFPAGRICRRGGGFHGRGRQIGNHLRRFGSLF